MSDQFGTNADAQGEEMTDLSYDWLPITDFPDGLCRASRNV